MQVFLFFISCAVFVFDYYAWSAPLDSALSSAAFQFPQLLTQIFLKVNYETTNVTDVSSNKLKSD